MKLLLFTLSLSLDLLSVALFWATGGEAFWTALGVLAAAGVAAGKATTCAK